MSGSPMDLIFSTNAGGKVVSMPKIIPIFFTSTPPLGNTYPAFARPPLLLENPKDTRWERFDQSFFILAKKGGFVSDIPRRFSTCGLHQVKRHLSPRDTPAGYELNKFFLCPK